MAGDLNGPLRDPTLAPLARRFQDAFGLAGFGFGYTTPLQRLDYVLVSRDFGVEAAGVVGGGESDHAAVEARVWLPSQ